jgi:hypothetical protein
MSAPTRHWTERLQDFDRRWIFLAMGLAVVLPLLRPCNFPVKPSPMVKAAYYSVEDLKEGDRVLLTLDLDPASTPELEPFYRAVILQLKRKNIKIAITTTWYAAPPLVTRWIRDSIETPIIKEGDTSYEGAPDRAYVANEDYVWLGFKEGREATINGMASDLRQDRGRFRPGGHGFGGLPGHQGVRATGAVPR